MNPNKEFIKNIFLASAVLEVLGVPNNPDLFLDGAQITFDWCGGDGVCHGYSYGHNNKRIETMGFPWDNGDVSCLDIKEFVAKVANLYHEKMAG